MSSGGSSGAGISAELVENLVEITACTPAEAEYLLSACDNNVEAAVALFFEQGASASSSSSGGGSASTASTGSANSSNTGIDAVAADQSGAQVNGMEDDIRAPIAPVREQLIGPEDDNFFASAAPPPTRRLARVAQRVKVCPLRDFAREAALMEEQLQAADMLSTVDLVARSRRRDRIADITTALSTAVAAHGTVADTFSRPGTSRLGDLFRPPTDLLYTGTFSAARSHATKRKQWLLVNVQNDNFESQLLNRDVWSDKKLRRLVRKYYTLWQVESDASEGRRFIAFYKCVKLPYVCVIDPRTGEEMWRSIEPKQSNMLNDLQKFLSKHNDFSAELTAAGHDEEPSTSKRSLVTAIDIDDDDDDDETSCSSSSNSNQVSNKRARIMELTEEEQIALAIKNSINEKNGNGNSNGSTTNGNAIDEDNLSDFGSVEEFGEDELKTVSETKSYIEELGTAKNEVTALKLRLFNADGTDEVVLLQWPSDTMFKVLQSYIAQQQPHIPKQGYKIICAFPRKTIEVEHNKSTLKELGLHPSANLHLTLED